MPTLVRAKVLVPAGLAVALAACSASPGGGDDGGAPPSVPAPGTFVWTANGQTLTATMMMVAGVSETGYQVTADPSGLRFGVIILATAPTGETCLLLGYFADAAPSPAGTYPIVERVAAFARDAVFVASCAAGPTSSGAEVVFSQSGQVILTKSEVGDIEGTFTMRGAPNFSSAPPTGVVGAFNLGCMTGTGYKCGPHAAVPPAGNCGDLLACCGADMGCMNLYTASMPNGDTACGRVFSVDRAIYCP